MRTASIITSLTTACATIVLSAGSVTTQAQGSDGPRYTPEGQLVRPVDYREWVYLTSGLGMTYGPAEAATKAAPLFDNVFVNRTSYREFMQSGRWPEKTMFILEVRRADENISINNGGRTQGALAFIEAAVKDREKFPDSGWGYYNFNGPNGPLDATNALPATAPCYTCHKNNTAVENTFVQFYPTLMEVAKKMGTVKPTYDPSRKP